MTVTRGQIQPAVAVIAFNPPTLSGTPNNTGYADRRPLLRFAPSIKLRECFSLLLIRILHFMILCIRGLKNNQIPDLLLFNLKFYTISA